jgi:glycosyltransferase involved in cell wall biosynthesis
MSDSKIPRVSIGLPVYNGEKYLEQAIESILSQTYTDFELIISDNASTDRTPEICRKYADRDLRIRYSRNTTNIGGGNNTNLTFQLARGEYFRWAAHDDVCAPQLLEKCVEVLDRNPDVFLCSTGIIEIDAQGERRSVTTKHRADARSTFTRFRFLSTRSHRCEAIYGVIRSDILRKTQLLRNYTDSDRVLLCELGLHGRFEQIPDLLFYKRSHAGNRYKDWRGRMAWFTPGLANTGWITFPNWYEFFNYFAVVRRSEVSWYHKALCYLWLAGPWPFIIRRGLVGDVLVAMQMLTRSKEERKRRYADVDSWS